MKNEFDNSKVCISVVMPVYNAGRYLHSAVDSILSQDFPHFELLLVDDGSTDGSSEICDQYAVEDSRVIVIHQQNKGICNARNTALKKAKGEYIAFSDHDDEYLPGFLKNAYEKACKHHADLVKVGKKEFIINDAHIQRKIENRLPYRVLDRAGIKYRYFSLVDNRTLDCVWDGLYKRELLVRNELWFDEDYKHGGEDIDFNQRYLRYINIIVTIDHCYYLHYIRKGFSTSSKFSEANSLMLEKKMATIEDTMKALYISLEENKFDYTYLLFRQYIVNICSHYSSRQLNLSRQSRCHAVALARESRFYHGFCDRQLVVRFMARSMKYGVLYFFYKYRQYSFILRLF